VQSVSGLEIALYHPYHCIDIYADYCIKLN